MTDGGSTKPDAGSFPDAGGGFPDGGKTDGGSPEAGPPPPDGGYAIADSGTPDAILATPCADGDPYKCMFGTPLVYDKKMQLPIAFDWDTGWIPDGSPVQVRFYVKLPAYTRVQMKGSLEATWPPAIKLVTPGLRKTGLVDFDYGLEVGAKAKIDVSVLGKDFGWEGDIPYLPKVDFHVTDSKGFDPWGFAPGATADGFTSKVTLIQVDITDALIPIPGIGGGLELDVQGELGVNYTNKKIVITPSKGPITSEDGETEHAWVQGAWAEYLVHPEGTVKYVGTLHLIPSFFIEILSKKFSIPLYDYPYSLDLAESEWVFDDQLVHVPLPDVRPPKDLVIKMGKVEVGQDLSVTVKLPNIGEAKAHMVAKTDGSAFKVLNNFANAEPGKEASIEVKFSPKTTGDANGTLTIETNDPDTPVIVIKLEGEGEPEPPPPDDPPTDAGTKPPRKKDAGPRAPGSPEEPEEDAGAVDATAVDDAGQSGACGCRAAGSPAPRAAAGLSLLGLALAARRRNGSRRKPLSLTFPVIPRRTPPAAPCQSPPPAPPPCSPPPRSRPRRSLPRAPRPPTHRSPAIPTPTSA